MKNKKILLSIIIIIVILLLFIFLLINNSNHNDEVVDNFVEDEVIPLQGDENLDEIVTIQSTPKNPISMDNIEVSEIKITGVEDQLKVVSTIKNNTSETLNGFFIQIDLLDANGNVITTLSENSNENIEANGGTTAITNYVSGISNGTDIVNAKISSLDKNNIKDTLDNAFDSIEQEAENLNSSNP